MPEPNQLLQFISGPGGTGKSHLLKAMRQCAQRHFALNYGHEGKPGDEKLIARSPEELVSLVLAFTGRAGTYIIYYALFSVNKHRHFQLKMFPVKLFIRHFR